MKRLYRFLVNLRFGFPEVDVTLNGLEMIQVICLCAVIGAAYFLVKYILGVIL